MGYFPLFVQLEDSRCLIVGGGNVAYRKAQQFALCGANLTVVAMECIPELENLQNVEVHYRRFCETDLDGKQFVVAATGNHILNKEIAMLCRKRNILINAVDDIDNCSFLFPALIRKGNLCIGISTSGSSPSAAKYIRDKIQEILSSADNWEEILAYLAKKRQLVQQYVSDKGARTNLLLELFLRCVEAHGALEESEFQSFLDCVKIEKDENE